MSSSLYRYTSFGLIAFLSACGGGDAPAPGDQQAATSNGQAGSVVSAAPLDSQQVALPQGDGGSALTGGSTSGAPGSNTPTGGAAASGSQGGARPPADADLPLPVPTSEANAILARAEQAYSQIRSMEADFTQALYVPLLESTQNSRGRMFHRSPDRFLMRFTDPAGDIIVADGRYVWMYYPSTDDKQVIRTQLSSAGQQVDLYREFLADATSRFAASLDASESVGGRPAKALTLIPRQASPYRRVRIWVDNQDSLVRKFEISEENGSVRTLQLSGLRLNGTLGDDLFRFTPPAGVQVHDF
jgi:outer membrane lipoprotein carrier protein